MTTKGTTNFEQLIYIIDSDQQKAFIHARDFIYRHLVKRQPDITRQDVAIALIDFARLHNLQALSRYIRYCQNHKVDAAATMATVMHDLNGRRDPCFSPRSSSY